MREKYDDGKVRERQLEVTEREQQEEGRENSSERRRRPGCAVGKKRQTRQHKAR